MELRRGISKRRTTLLLLLFFVLLILWVMPKQSYVVHRLFTKVFTGYEIYLLEYPNSQLVDSEIRATSKMSMVTDYNYHTLENVDTVREYLEAQRPGFVRLQGSRVINEPTYRNSVCADKTVVRTIFQVLDKGSPCINVYIYPSATGGTSIKISEDWYSIGFPMWLRKW